MNLPTLVEERIKWLVGTFFSTQNPKTMVLK
jgi:hypothetical protein